MADEDTKAKLLGLPILAGLIAFHGTPEPTVRVIQKEGGLKPYGKEGVKKISGGNMDEQGLIWLTPDEPIAKQYAEGWESNMHRREGKEPVKPGAIFKSDLPDNIKLIDRDKKLTQAEVDLLNPMLPSYKPLHAGDSFSSFTWRSNGNVPLSDAIKALGYEGMKYGDKQIAVVSDFLPAELHKDLRTHAAKTESPVKAGKGVEELKPVVEAELERLKQYPIVARLLGEKNIPIEIQDTMGTGALRTGPNQYEAGVAGLYVPERLGPRERIYLADQPVQGDFGTGYQTGVPYSQVTDVQATLRHELMHPIYERLNDEWLHNVPAQKATRVLEKIDQLSKEYQPSEYAKESPNEWLSETFAKYTHPEYPKFKDLPPKVEEFMKRVVNAAKLKNIDLTGLSLALTIGGPAIIAQLLFGDDTDFKKNMGMLLGGMLSANSRRFMYEKIPASKEIIVQVNRKDLPVIKNPTPSQIEYMNHASGLYWKKLVGQDMRGLERNLRLARDKDGNYYFWDGSSAIHSEVVKKLKLEGAEEGYLTSNGKEIQFKDSKNVDVGPSIPISELRKGQ